MANSTIGTDARQYFDVDSWIADLPATTTEDETALMYNDSEFITPSGIVLSGINNSNFLITIKPAVGEAFNDTEQALRYNQANGVGIRKLSKYNQLFYVDRVDNVLLENLQLKADNAKALRLGYTDNFSVKNSIIQANATTHAISGFNATNTKLINNAIINTTINANGRGIDMVGANWTIVNNTIIALNSSNTLNTGITHKYGAASSAIVKNNILINFSTALQASTWNGANVNHNATDAATIGGGANNLTSLVAADQFEDLTGVNTLDLRLKIGNSLDGSGVPESSFTNDLDIFFNTRNLISPSIGGYETTANAPSITRKSKKLLVSVNFSSRLSKVHNTNSNILQRNTKNFHVFSDMLLRQEKAFIINKDLLGRKKTAFFMNTDFYQRVNKSFEINSDYLSANRVHKSFSISVDLLERMQKNFAVELDILQRSSLSHDVITSILNRISTDFVTRFNLNSRASYSHQFSLDFIQRIGKQHTIQITLLSDEISSQHPKYVITVANEVNFSDTPTIEFNFNDTPTIEVSFVSGQLKTFII